MYCHDTVNCTYGSGVRSPHYLSKGISHHDSTVPCNRRTKQLTAVELYVHRRAQYSTLQLHPWNACRVDSFCLQQHVLSRVTIK